jgi:NADP-dependent 3-hydroxy acid dehydrogenase YdfG
MKHLIEQVVAVSGASSGIGQATARHLAGLGAKVAIGARRVDRLQQLAAELRSADGAVMVQPLDVRDRGSFEAFVAATVAEFGRIDVLVNNAGVMPLSTFGALRVDE